MMSLSKEWAILSRAMYGKELIDELTNFLRGQYVKTILECGCGDGNILKGLAERGFKGLGIDECSEMIQMANQNNRHSNIEYRRLNWLDLDRIPREYDCVICRGNSLSYVISWRTQEPLNAKLARAKIIESLEKMWKRLKSGGLLYVDTVKESDVKESSRKIQLDYPSINLTGRIDIDLEKRVRRAWGEGVVCGEKFSGGTECYLLSPQELEREINTLNPKKMWRPNLENELNYTVICAKK